MGLDNAEGRSPTGVVPRKSNWSVYWRNVTASVGIEGLHCHDLRHTGNTLVASTGASTKELMSRMGHASTRAAILSQQATRERDDAIAAGLDILIRGGTGVRRSNGTEMTKQRFVRPGDRLDDNTVLVVRGGERKPTVLSEDAETMYAAYGVSVFAIRDRTLDELAQRSPLVRFGTQHRIRGN